MKGRTVGCYKLRVGPLASSLFLLSLSSIHIYSNEIKNTACPYSHIQLNYYNPGEKEQNSKALPQT